MEMSIFLLGKKTNKQKPYEKNIWYFYLSVVVVPNCAAVKQLEEKNQDLYLATQTPVRLLLDNTIASTYMLTEV